MPKGITAEIFLIKKEVEFMALTNKQVRGVCNMFANAFVNAKNDDKDKENANE